MVNNLKAPEGSSIQYSRGTWEGPHTLCCCDQHRLSLNSDWNTEVEKTRQTHVQESWAQVGHVHANGVASTTTATWIFSAFMKHSTEGGAS